MKPQIDSVSHINHQHVFRLEGVRDAFSRACDGARAEFTRRYKELVPPSSQGPEVVRIIEALDIKHRDEEDAVFTRRDYGKQTRSSASFRNHRGG